MRKFEDIKVGEEVVVEGVPGRASIRYSKGIVTQILLHSFSVRWGYFRFKDDSEISTIIPGYLTNFRKRDGIGYFKKFKDYKVYKSI